jgi:L-threonylcarbamoyladenylate synthase
MVRIRSEQPEARTLVLGALTAGGVVVVPTDTLYGLSTRLSSRGGHDRICAMKKGPVDRRFLYLADSVDRVEEYIGGWGCASRRSFEEIWPAPLTAIFRAGPRCPDWVGGTIAVRIPGVPWTRGVIEALGEPLLSTSVNEAGKPPLEDVDSIEIAFGSLVDIIVDAGRLHEGIASTLVDLTGSSPVVVRQGSYVWPGGGKPSN